MSLRFIFWMLVLIGGCLWMLRRPVVGVWLNLAFVPLNPAQFGTGLEGVRFQFIATACLVVSYLIHHRSFGKMGKGGSGPLVLIVLWLLWAMIVSTWAVHSQALALEACLQYSKVLLLTFLLSRIIADEKEMRITLWVLFVSFGVKAFLDRWGVAWGYGVREGLSGGSLRSSLALVLPTMAFLVLSSKRWWEWALAVLLTPFILDCFVLKGVRSGFASVAAAGGLSFFFAPKAIRRSARLGIACVALGFVFFLTNPKFWDRMATILDPHSEGSAASRFIINRASWAMVKDYPMGVGLDNYQWVSPRYLEKRMLTGGGTIRSAHNTFLNTLAETGWPGFVLWLTAFGWVWFRLLRISRMGPPAGFVSTTARGLSIGGVAIFPALWTHTGGRFDCLYWVIAFSIVLLRLSRQVEAKHDNQKNGPMTQGLPARGQRTLSAGDRAET